MTRLSRRRPLLCTATFALGLFAAVRLSSQAPAPFVGTLDEHPAIRYGDRRPADRVARLNEALDRGDQTLRWEPKTGFLTSVLDALGVPVESQLLVFSKTGLQRDYTGPRNPRALYFNESVAVGYIPGAPSLELAAHDPQQGVMFYTLDGQAGGAPRFTRRNECLTCHLSVATLEVPGMIVRSHMVGADGQLLPRTASHVVNHRTPHTERWGGWFVTGQASAPPYGPLGNLGNVTVTPHPSSGPAILSNHVLIEWLNRPSGVDRYPASDSDLAALMTFDHQMHAINLMTRLNWDARVAAAEGREPASEPAVRDRVFELADYLLFVGEAPLDVTVTPRPGFAEALAARAPVDSQGRSCAQLELETRLLKHPCSYMIYSDAFEALPPAVKDAVYRRMFDALSGRVAGPSYAHLSADDRRAIMEIVRETRPDLPADLRPGQTDAPGKPRVAVLTTGGTIASRAGATMQDGGTLVAAVPQLADYAEIGVEEVARVGSSQITPAHWLTLARRINAMFERDVDLRGIVVTHGTDTLEDTAFFLHLSVRHRRPVVVTGSMRSATEISADGPANLLNAVRVAVSDDAAGKGVLVALNEHIASARDVWKTDNRRVETFRSPELGFLGYVDPDGVAFYRTPTRAHTADAGFDLRAVDELPDVPIVTDYPGFDGFLAEAVIARKPAGLVVSGFAGGRLSAGGRRTVERAAAAGIPVVVASHVPGGRIVGNPVGSLKVVVARDLPPNKARVLLMLALTRSHDVAELQRVFDRY